MRILAIDIGGGTQDILLFDSSQTIENYVKMIMPSPTIVVANKIRVATESGHTLAITGMNMGGGPSTWALRRHLKAGLKAYATAAAAATFNDDISEVAGWGVGIVRAKDMPKGEGVVQIRARDLDLAGIGRALKAFNVAPEFDGIAVAVLDHGAAPPGVSDRLFRFQHLERVVKEKRGLTAFAYLADEVPDYLTRMKDVARGARTKLPLLLMDTPVAAVIGSMEDPEVARHSRKVVMNLGNFHTLAFHMEGGVILGYFEHHTGMLTREKVEELVDKLVTGRMSPREVYDDGGHGNLVIEVRGEVPFVSVTGPRRSLMHGSKMSPYFTAPYGDMMLTGCFGLVRAFAERKPEWRGEIEKVLGKSHLA